MTALISAADAEALDRADTLQSARAHFDLPSGVIYLDGNSLGPPPRAALQRLAGTAQEEWGQGLITSWNDAGWMDLPLTTGARLARLIGVAQDEVIALDTVTLNIFKLAGALIRLRPGKALAVEAGDFPTDGYVAEGLARFLGRPFHLVAPGTPPSRMPDDVGVFVKSAVHYKTAEIADIAGFEAEARARDLDLIWDLSHATGLVDLRLAEDGARFAVGCGYKFLNGGPGAPAFLYCRSDMIGRMEQPVPGWLGHASPFAFTDGYRPAEGIRRFLTSSPPVLGLACLNAALEAYQGVDLAKVERKAGQLGDIVLQAAAELGLASISPAMGQRRGGHVCIRHPDAYAIVQALIARGIIGDFRAPDLMRFGFNPLYLSFAEVRAAAQTLIEVIESRAFEKPEFSVRKAVT